jgi:hypothetical protein
MENKNTIRTSYTENGKEYSIIVRKISNGWIVCKRCSWTEGEGDKRQWKEEETETYYKENPTEKDTKNKSTIDALGEMLAKIDNLKSLC